MTRLKASLIHLALSASLIGAVALLVLWRWYPPALLEMARAAPLLGTLAAVDVVLGPLLTFIVYKQGKKSLRFDLTVIVLLQAGALLYGLHTLWQSRPVFLVANVDRFDLVYANEIAPEDLAAAPPSYRQLPALGPQLVGALMPTDTQARNHVLDSSLAGRDLQQLPAYYVDYAVAWPSIRPRARSLSTVLPHLAPPEQRALQRAAEASGHPLASLLVVPLSSSRGNAAMLVSQRVPQRPIPVAVDIWPVFNAMVKM